MLKEHQPESQNIVIGKMSNPQRYRSWKLQTQKYSYNVPPCQEPQSNFEIGGGGGGGYISDSILGGHTRHFYTQYWGGGMCSLAPLLCGLSLSENLEPGP